MSLFGALQSGISGLASQSNSMASISDNISNVNTIGYKNNNVSFSTLVTKQTSSHYYSAGGVQPNSKQYVDAQGLLASNSSSTALGISGSGFFVVNTSANPGASDTWAYTRAGDFDVDNQGYLKNSSGFYLQGWSLLPWNNDPNATVVNINGINYMKAYYDANGNTVLVNDNTIDANNLKPINLKTIGGTASATQQISLGGNLPADANVYDPSVPSSGGKYSFNALIYDSLGNSSNVSMNYIKQSSNSWGMSTSIPSGAATITLSGGRETTNATDDVYYAAGQLEFSSIPKNGSTITITDASTGQEVTFEFVENIAGQIPPLNNTATHRYVEIKNGITSASDVVTNLVAQMKEALPGADRFTADSSRVVIEQSTGGAALTIDASKTLACVQSAANPVVETGIPTGIFTIQSISNDIKNTASITFTGEVDDYEGKEVSIGGKTYTIGAGADVDLDNCETVADIVAALVDLAKADIADLGDLNASGMTLEFNPSSTGGEIEFDFTDLNGLIKGQARQTTIGLDGAITSTWLTDDAMASKFTMNNKFVVNTVDVETGSIVPAVRFNADGTPKYFFVDDMSIQWANGAQNMDNGEKQGTSISLIMGNAGTNDGLTSLAGDFNTNYINQDGATFGSYAGVSIDENGIVTAQFDNGETRPIAILPIATFANPNGLSSLTGNAWIETDYSGQALLKTGGTNGAGKVTANSLEQSTVDLATEFSNMIVTQRAYSAATKIITAADEMLDELTRMT